MFPQVLLGNVAIMQNDIGQSCGSNVVGRLLCGTLLVMVMNLFAAITADQGQGRTAAPEAPARAAAATEALHSRIP